MPAMHLIKFPGRVHDFRHFWLGATMGDTRGPQTPASSIIHIFWQRVAGPCPGPVCNFDMKFFFLLLFLCMPFFFFFFEPAPSFSAYSKRCVVAYVRIYIIYIYISVYIILMYSCWGISYAWNHFMCNLVQIHPYGIYASIHPSLLFQEIPNITRVYSVYIGTCTGYVQMLPAASADIHSRGPQKIFAQRPTNAMTAKSFLSFPISQQLHGELSPGPRSRLAYEIMRTNSPCNAGSAHLDRKSQRPRGIQLRSFSALPSITPEKCA